MHVEEHTWAPKHGASRWSHPCQLVSLWGQLASFGMRFEDITFIHCSISIFEFLEVKDVFCCWERLLGNYVCVLWFNLHPMIPFLILLSVLMQLLHGEWLDKMTLTYCINGWAPAKPKLDCFSWLLSKYCLYSKFWQLFCCVKYYAAAETATLLLLLFGQK